MVGKDAKFYMFYAETSAPQQQSIKPMTRDNTHDPATIL